MHSVLPILELAASDGSVVQLLSLDVIRWHPKVKSRVVRIALSLFGDGIVRVDPIVCSLVDACTIIISLPGLHLRLMS